MEWHINDLSLRGQFNTPEEIKSALTQFFLLRLRRKDLKDRIYCSKSLLTRPASATHTLHEALIEMHDQNFYSTAIRWLGNAGPFWEDSRQQNDEDLFYWKEKDVTDQGLGEAARRRLTAVHAGSFSFVEPNDEFDLRILNLTHGLLEQPIGLVEVQNFRSIEELEACRIVEITGWENMIVAAAAYTHLQLSPEIIDFLKPRPFHVGIAERLLQLLTILDKISAEITPEGELTDEGHKLVQLYFVGKKALFSDEDDKGTKVFNFSDPDGGSDLHCSWHGKVKMGGQFRVHFQWPKPKGQERLKVVYLGEKLTKH